MCEWNERPTIPKKESAAFFVAALPDIIDICVWDYFVWVIEIHVCNLQV